MVRYITNAERGTFVEHLPYFDSITQSARDIAPGALLLASLHPVHNLQVRHPSKLPGVMCHHHIPPSRRSGDRTVQEKHQNSSLFGTVSQEGCCRSSMKSSEKAPIACRVGIHGSSVG